MISFPSCALASILAIGLATSTASAVASYTFPFGTYNPGDDLNGLDGWVTDDPGSLPGGHIAFVGSLGPSVAGGIGGFYNEPASLSRVTVSNVANVGLNFLTFSTDFAIAQSTEAVPGRDGFGFSFLNGSGGNLLTILFEPVASVNNDAFQVRYTVGAGPTVNALDGNSDQMFIYHNGQYSLDLTVTGSGANPTFSAMIDGSNDQTFVGTLTGLGGSEVARFGALWDVEDAGNNFMYFDNVSIVPEPGTATLLGLAGLGLLRRRRRN